MIKIIRTSAFILSAAMLGGCWGGVYEHPASQYIQRTDTITLSAGNAKDVNAATHVIDPWPRRVANPRIPANGERMAGRIERYRGRQAQRPEGQAGQPTSAASPGAETTSPGTSRAGTSTY